MQSTSQPRATPSDEDLAGAAAAGSPNAFTHLVERYAAPLLAVVERRCGDHHLALDLAQEIWIKVFRGLALFESERRFRPWLFAIALNHARDEQRKSFRQPARTPLGELFAELSAKPENGLEGRDERARIEGALDRVHEPYRSAVHFVDVLGLSYEEAAASLSCSAGTLKSRVHRGRLAFQDAYLAGAQRLLQRIPHANRPTNQQEVD